MNHFPARALSLILAVLLLLSAAGISFAAVLSGTRVYAEEGGFSAQTSAEPESAPPPKTSAPDIIFVSSSTSGGRLTAQADKADNSTPDNERSSSASNGSSSAADSSSSETSSDNSPDDAIAEIQSLTFFNNNGAPVSEVRPNTHVTMKVEISDEGVSRDE